MRLGDRRHVCPVGLLLRRRRDLVGKVFFSWYEPRLRDNQQRAQERKPLRGGPLESGAPDA